MPPAAQRARFLLAPVALFACAALPNPPAAPAPQAGGALGDAPGDAPRLQAEAPADLTDLALVASGAEGSSLRGARVRFESFAAPIVDGLRAVAEPRDRARRLLLALHAKGGLLGEYDARATTLLNVLEERRYNCVSASVLYNLLAERLGLEAQAQLLPTHARTVLAVPAGARPGIIVETTSPQGFDPDARLEAAILAQIGGAIGDGRALVSERGSVVSTAVLIGTIYVNRASILQEGGDLNAAERLFARGEAIADSPSMRQILRDQRAALLSQLGADDVLSDDPARLERAYRSLRAAVALQPEELQIRGAVLQNLRAAAERLIHRLADQKAEAELLRLAGEAAAAGLEAHDRSGLRAFALSEVARLRIEAGSFDPAVEAIEQALAEQLGPGDAKLRRALEQNRVSALRLAAITFAKRGEYAPAMRAIERLRALPRLEAADRQAVEQDHLHVIHLVGNRRIDASDFPGAAEIYREGVRRFPEDTTSRHNLLAVLERLALPLISKGLCSEAEVYLDEIRALDRGSRFPAEGRVRCLVERAKERLDASDYAEAVELMRAARKASPAEPAVTTNLAVALLRWTSSLSAAGSCARAASLVRELRALASTAVSASDVKLALGPCRD